MAPRVRSSGWFGAACCTSNDRRVGGVNAEPPIHRVTANLYVQSQIVVGPGEVGLGPLQAADPEVHPEDRLAGAVVPLRAVERGWLVAIALRADVIFTCQVVTAG